MEKFDSIDKYYLAVTSLLKRIYEEERINIEKAADVLVKAIKEDRLVHVFGTGGHSAMGAEEMFYRAGGLVPINPILDPGIVLHFG
ncbi:MAG: SIS domain-containing protein, partial [archaeon YNP-LCB-024-027]|nr:SIS domain-containing protein [Candidatus Culexarchaeum yellowstonense]